jgi:hypothetical protein
VADLCPNLVGAIAGYVPNKEIRARRLIHRGHFYEKLPFGAHHQVSLIFYWRANKDVK